MATISEISSSSSVNSPRTGIRLHRNGVVVADGVEAIRRALRCKNLVWRRTFPGDPHDIGEESGRPVDKSWLRQKLAWAKN